MNPICETSDPNEILGQDSTKDRTTKSCFGDKKKERRRDTESKERVYDKISRFQKRSLWEENENKISKFSVTIWDPYVVGRHVEEKQAKI